ncbi:hypothetical protein Pan54_30340 [Rubinisphaera italica]|uniref:Uncharacterized protein n=1 Tax=Rubinisphaera italica TaxID=2527969 RepID=A0A5C5XJ03_9PLAN|nr:hypothetical protein Pan54_30340 [Rubinisphaera italica]
MTSNLWTVIFSFTLRINLFVACFLYHRGTEITETAHADHFKRDQINENIELIISSLCPLCLCGFTF